MTSSLLRPLLTCLLFLIAACLPAGAAEAGTPRKEGVRQHWDQSWRLVLREPVVSRTVVENGARLEQWEKDEARRREQGREEGQEGEAAVSPPSPRPSAEDCGLHLVTVSGSPAPRLRWVDQNVLGIEFAPGSSPETEYTITFKPGTTYLGGAPLQTSSFTFRCKPASFRAEWLPGCASGAVLLSAAWHDTLEAQQLPQKHEGLRVSFRRLREIPFVGWVCTGTVPARLRPATLGDGVPDYHGKVLEVLLESMKPEAIREDTPLPRSLVAEPMMPLVPGANYELGVEAAPGSGFKGESLGLGYLSEGMSASLSRKLVQQGKGKQAPWTTQLELRFSSPLREDALRALWGRLGIELNGIPATLQADGSYAAEVGGEKVRLSLRGLKACEPNQIGSRGKRTYHYAPKGCAEGLDIMVQATQPLEIALTLPQGVVARHGLPLRGERTLHTSVSPATPAMTGNGINQLAWSGSHRMRLPVVNLGSATATAYHWQAEDAARLLPLIHQGLRDDTVFCELFRRLHRERRRAAEGLSTEGWEDDARTESARALNLLRREMALAAPLRAQVLSSATPFATQPLALVAGKGSHGLVARGEAELDLDALTGGQTRPGLYLISVTAHPSAEVQGTLASYGMTPEEAAQTCTVDYLVQVTDMSLCRAEGKRVLLASLANGQALTGAQVTQYALPEVEKKVEDSDDARLAAARQEAQPVAGATALPVPQGEIALPQLEDNSLLLFRRGEDYALLTASGYMQEPDAEKPATGAMVELFCDRPLYRPGDVAHLRGVLRRPTRGGLALLRARKGTLIIHNPKGEVMETRELTLDAYGAFATDVALPAGEEDVTGTYRCLLKVEEEGNEVQKSIHLPCEVFRRDAFTVELRTELNPVAPKGYRVEVKATDYNGTPVAKGKLRLKLTSTAQLWDGKGQKPEGLTRYAHADSLVRELTLDEEGHASLSGAFEPLEKEGWLRVSEASVANDREEYVKVSGKTCEFSPADFRMALSYSWCLRLLDARCTEEEKPLGRTQEVEFCIMQKKDTRRELPSGFSYAEEKEQVLARRRLHVPANCTEGVNLLPYLKEVEREAGRRCRLVFTAQDAEGRRICKEEQRHLPDPEDGVEKLGFSPDELVAEGRTLRFKAGKSLGKGRLHAFISSQGRMRHTLVKPEDGEREVLIPLRPKEYGRVSVTLVRCGRDRWGTFSRWDTLSDMCVLPRPDKELRVEFQLPSGAKPGEQVELSGRVLGADGKPVKAAVTLFAVDAGMMSVAPYTLPKLARDFYLGSSRILSLQEGAWGSSPRVPEVRALLDVWTGGESGWYAGLPEAGKRSVWPEGLRVKLGRASVGKVFRGSAFEVVRAAAPSFRWTNLLDWVMMTEYQCAPAPEAMPCWLMETSDGLGEGPGAGGGGMGSAVYGFSAKLAKHSPRTKSLAEVDALWDEGAAGAAPEPRLRRNFEPVALWLASLETDADGHFRTACRLPDTLTTYKTCAVALDVSGTAFGQAEGEFLVNQELMLTAGTPFFMSCGDRLLLPLTITNNTDTDGQWEVTLEGAGHEATQPVALAAHKTATLFYEVRAGEEGSCTLRWTARAANGADAVEGSFPVRYPAPVLKEVHRLVLAEGGEAVQAAGLLAAEVADATRGEVEVQYSSSPLIHLAGSVDFLLSYPYGCTEQSASALMPWILYEKLAPFCPQMAQTPAEKAREVVERGIGKILARQQEDGGLSYWPVPRGERGESCAWASAHAALVLTIAQEQGVAVPAEAMDKLRRYLGRQSWSKMGYRIQYAAARARGKKSEVNRILVKALRKELEQVEKDGFDRDTADLEFLAALSSNPAGRHEALLTWLRSKGRDYRHRTSWSGGWTLIALADYLRHEPASTTNASLSVNGQEYPVETRAGSVCLKPGAGQCVRDIAPVLAPGKGTTYASIRVKAQPEQTDYPGVTEKGLQVTRLYETQDAQGQWHPVERFKVGEVVRVTLTCAKMADTLEYFVLEDYLPACMEAINPRVPGQAAGLPDGGWGTWSRWFDHKEYLADRVRGFCTRWEGRDVVNMSYYARVKRAGESMAPPAEAQLMYEPQTYGLSPNTRVVSE